MFVAKDTVPVVGYLRLPKHDHSDVKLPFDSEGELTNERTGGAGQGRLLPSAIRVSMPRTATGTTHARVIRLENHQGRKRL